MNAFRGARTILGCLVALWGVASIPEAPRAVSEAPSVAPVTTWQPYDYLEVPAGAEEAAATSTTTPPPPSTTTVWVRQRPRSECEVALQTALDVGWPANQLARLAVVLWRESRCATTGKSFNPGDPNGGSFGGLQINGYWCKPNSNWPKGWLQAQNVITNCEDLFDLSTNLRAGLAIYRNSGWQPWGIK